MGREFNQYPPEFKSFLSTLLDEYFPTPLSASELAELARQNASDEELALLLQLPNEILLKKIYPHFDFASRRALRTNRRLEAIEMETKYQCKKLRVTINETDVTLWCDETEMNIPMCEVEKELELMGINTLIDFVVFKSHGILFDRRNVNAMSHLRAKRIWILYPSINIVDLLSLVQHKEGVELFRHWAINADGIMSIYEQMRDRQLHLKDARFLSREVEVRWQFIDLWGRFDRDSKQFRPTNPDLEYETDDNMLAIQEGTWKITIKGISVEDRDCGYILIHYMLPEIN